eukprot:2745704-Rhodomonas_salina.1
MAVLPPTRDHVWPIVAVAVTSIASRGPSVTSGVWPCQVTVSAQCGASSDTASDTRSVSEGAGGC